MIYLDLFWTYFKIGLFTIGGGQAMIPMIIRDVVAKGWLSELELIDFIAISESTPGVFAVNVATYSGTNIAGVLGGLCSTLGVVLPSIIIISLIAIFFSQFMKKKAVEDVFNGVRSAVTGLLISVFLTLMLTILFGISNIYDTSSTNIDYIGIGLFAVLFGISFVKVKGKKISPILIILISAILGLICYAFIPI